MIWKKHSLIWQPDGTQWWAKSHATCPTPLLLPSGDLRLYMQCRDADGIGRAGYIDVDADAPNRVLRVCSEPCLDIGLPGTFDENGVLPTCVVALGDGRLLMYYVGFELGTSIRYRLLTGLAISEDGGNHFSRVHQTPVLERSDEELFFRCAAFVLQDHQRIRMWYAGGGSWTSINDKLMPCYDLRHIESPDGFTWPGTGQIVLPVTDDDEHGFGRPWVLKSKAGYQLFFSVRKRSLGQYRLAYAESPDGIHWTRRDELLGLDISPGKWDGEAVMYSAVIQAAGHTWLFYNGNNFGEHGMGFAELESV
jgi:predicted GH43/DUF377 family glycosyl hydrolase